MKTAFDEPPQWAKEAIWYQIFVERFRNGNPDNLPTIESTRGATIDQVPEDWTITSWGHNWYEQEPWAKNTKLDFYRTVQLRRYGGDLQGVIDKIDYLKQLGINAIYFNPLNDAPSLHKYDARHYHHIDVTFGNDRDGDIKLIEQEDKSDPSKWVWTNADKLFLDLIKKLHNEGIKIILDFSWNHTGTQFWAFKDIVKNGQNSAYKNWFEINQMDDPNTSKNEFDYDGWFGIKSLPEVKKIKETNKVHGHPYEGNLPLEVKEHIFAVCKRWMDPNGDGNPEDGIDGMRLDVAEHVPLGFWREFRKFVREINPEFYLVGENWWTRWPDELMDPAPWIKGDVFDAVMHYHWFRPTRAYINQGDDRITLEEYYNHIESIYSKYRPQTQHAMMNLISSHDTERALSGMYNTNKYKFKGKPFENRLYKTGKPDELAYQKFFTLLIQQFTFVGSPHIWNGDEMGMWGADDPDNRKPLLWPDIDFEIETKLYEEQDTYHDKPSFNKEVFDFYCTLIRLRKTEKALSIGTLEFIKNYIKDNIMAYKRQHEDDELIIFLNCDPKPKSIEADIYKDYKPIFNYKSEFNTKINLEGYSGIILKKR